MLKQGRHEISEQRRRFVLGDGAETEVDRQTDVTPEEDQRYCLSVPESYEGCSEFAVFVQNIPC